MLFDVKIFGWNITHFMVDISIGFLKVIIGIVNGFFQIGEAIYSVFETLALATDVFDLTKFDRLANNMYVIFGVVVLFVAAYNFLMFTVDPEKNSGDMSIEKMLKNTLKVLVIIVLLPTIFSLANGVIGSVVEGGRINTLIFGDTLEANNCPAGSKSNLMTKAFVDIFGSFFTSEFGKTSKEIKLATNNTVNGGYVPEDIVCPITKSPDQCTLYDVIEDVKCTGRYSDFLVFAANWKFSNGTTDNTGVSFQFFMAIVAVCYMIYVLISFCFDLGVRIIKLVFYQIIAPLCVGCMILPGPKKDIYTKWKSLTIKTYTLVLIRVFAVALGVFIISMLDNIIDRVMATAPDYCNWLCRSLVFIFLVLAILTFMKQIPKLIGEIIGEDDIGLGQTIRDKFKQSGALGLASKVAGVGAALGAGAVAKGRAIRNLWKKRHSDEMNAARKELKDAKGSKDKARIKEARAAKRRTARESGAGMLRGLANIGASGLGATLAYASKQTNGFGLNNLKKKMTGLKDNMLDAAGSNDEDVQKRDKNSATRNKLRNRRGDLKKLEKEKALAAAAGDTARVSALDTQIENAKADIAALETQTMTAQMKGKLMAALDATFSTDQTVALKAKEEVYAINDKNMTQVKTDGQTYLTKRGSNVKVASVLTETTEKIVGAGTPSAAVVEKMLGKDNCSYTYAQSQLSSVAEMNDQEFSRFIQSTMDSCTIDRKGNVKFKDASGHYVSTSLQELQTTLTSSIPGLKGELEKQTLARVNDYASASDEERSKITDLFVDNSAEAIGSEGEDFLKLESSIEVANAGLKQTAGRDVKTSKDRKEVMEARNKEIIAMRTESSKALNQQAINKANNPSGDKK